jgi:hypothetical protein
MSVKILISLSLSLWLLCVSYSGKADAKGTQSENLKESLPILLMTAGNNQGQLIETKGTQGNAEELVYSLN